jgi:hypothetical protein
VRRFSGEQHEQFFFFWWIDRYLRYYVGCEFPVEGEVAEDAFVELLDELHEQGVRVHPVVEEGQQVLLVALGLLQVIVGQRAEVRALVQILETDLRR